MFDTITPDLLPERIRRRVTVTRDVDGWLTPRGMDNALDALAPSQRED